MYSIDSHADPEVPVAWELWRSLVTSFLADDGGRDQLITAEANRLIDVSDPTAAIRLLLHTVNIAARTQSATALALAAAETVHEPSDVDRQAVRDGWLTFTDLMQDGSGD